MTKHTRMITIRLTPEEHANLIREVIGFKTSLNQFVRALLIHGTVAIRYIPVIEKKRGRKFKT